MSTVDSIFSTVIFHICMSLFESTMLIQITTYMNEKITILYIETDMYIYIYIYVLYIYMYIVDYYSTYWI